MIKGLSLKKITVILAIFLSAVSLYAALRIRSLSSRLREQKSDYERSSRQNFSCEDKYLKMKGEYDGLKTDLQSAKNERDKLTVQVRGLFADRVLARELEELTAALKKDIEKLGREKKEVLDKNAGLQKELQENKAAKEVLAAEKEELAENSRIEKDALTEAMSKTNLRKLEAKNAALEKEKNRLDSEFKKAQAEAANFKELAKLLSQRESNLKKEVQELEKKTDKMNRDYADALNKNKALEKKCIGLPREFAEVSRQNKVLTKRVSSMHYNLGVFFTKQKEYARAINEFQKALEVDPNDAYSHFNLGYIYAEYIINRPRSIEHFQKFLKLSGSKGKDVDWVKKYIITWQTWQGDEPME